MRKALMSAATKDAVMSIVSTGFAFMAIAVCVAVITVGTIRYGMPFGIALGCAPLVALLLLAVLKNPYWGTMSLFTINYFVIAIIRYSQISGVSMLIDIFSAITLVSIIINALAQPKKDVASLKNGLTGVACIWLLFCVLELLNPTSQYDAWILSRGIIYYLLVFTTLTFLTFNKYRDLKVFLYLLSIFTLLGVAKGAMQQFIGFDGAENRFLNEGGSRIHLLLSGTRYFSFYVSAGIFGAVMGHAIVVYTIAAVYVKGIKHKIYFLLVAAAALYGMMISGTRGAIAVPVAGFVLFIILSKKLKIIIPATLVLIGTYMFLAMTFIGQGNQYIRRMRTVLDPNEPSLLVRKANQALFNEYLQDKPFGEGIGLSGVDAQDISMRFTTSIPTDSWYVKIWVETGIVGLCLHIAILAYIIIYGSFLIMFRIENYVLKGFLTALLCGVFGILVTSYGNQVLGQFPVALIVYMSMAMVFMAKRFDKEISDNKSIST